DGSYWNGTGQADRLAMSAAVQSILSGPYLSGLQQYEANGAIAGARLMPNTPWVDVNPSAVRNLTSNPQNFQPTLQNYLQNAIDDPSTPLQSPDAFHHAVIYVVVGSPNASDSPGGFNYQLSYVNPNTKMTEDMNAIWVGTEKITDSDRLDRFTRTFSHEL